MSNRLRFLLSVSTLAGVFAAAAAQVAPIVVDDVSSTLANSITITSTAIGLTSAVLRFRVDRQEDGEIVTPQPTSSSQSINLFWVGATIALVLLAMISPAFLLLAVFTGMLAFRKRKAAAGVGVVIGGLALVLVLALLVPESSPSNEISQEASLCVTPFGITCPLPPGPIGVACHCGLYTGTSQ